LPNLLLQSSTEFDTFEFAVNTHFDPVIIQGAHVGVVSMVEMEEYSSKDAINGLLLMAEKTTVPDSDVLQFIQFVDLTYS